MADGLSIVSPFDGHSLPTAIGRRRLGGAFTTSFLSHVAFFFLFLFLATHGSAPVTEVTRALTDDLVWVSVKGPGGGGGGGGNQSVTPPRKLEQPGPDKVAIPVPKPPTPVTAPEPPKVQTIDPPMVLEVPFRAEQLGDVARSGTMDSASLAPPTSLGSGSGQGAGTGRGQGDGSGVGGGKGPGLGGGTGGGVYQVGNGVTAPELIHQVRPGYTGDAMRARIQGEVWISAIVLPDGTVSSATVIRSLDKMYGLDEEAIKAARQWRFKPGTRFGQPVAVQIDIAVTFSLR